MSSRRRRPTPGWRSSPRSTTSLLASERADLIESKTSTPVKTSIIIKKSNDDMILIAYDTQQLLADEQ